MFDLFTLAEMENILVSKGAIIETAKTTYTQVHPLYPSFHEKIRKDTRVVIGGIPERGSVHNVFSIYLKNFILKNM